MGGPQAGMTEASELAQPRLRILVAHNAYQHRGGEDSVVDSEIELLASRGHVVELYRRDNEEIPGMSSVSLAGQTIWSGRTHREIRERIANFRPDVIHVHNTLPLISPSLYWAASAMGVPVVQTLHNFRLMCLNALLLREADVCEDCVGTVPWRGVLRGCYRGSRPASAALATMLALHRGFGSYRRKVSRYIALNEFCRSKFIEAGLPEDRITVKPNFVDYPALPDSPRSGFLFVGRLSVEKGLATLAQAMALNSNIRLRVAGDGPEAATLEGLAGVTRLGSLPSAQVGNEMMRAQALVVPSIWYENFPRTIVEAYACGLPVIASRIGALAEIVLEGRTGLLFEPGNAEDLADKLSWADKHPEELARMGRQARTHYEANFSPETNYRQLLGIYREVTG
jgi:glycosyltransferase involved in cell wall biosynthesis